ncbi:beta-ketoacyl reductase, partial [Streptomyces goshikiensis]
MFRVGWTPVAVPPGPRPVTRWGLLGPQDERLLPAGFPVEPVSGAPDAVLLLCPPTHAEDAPAATTTDATATAADYGARDDGLAAVHEVAASVLGLLQTRLADDTATPTPLVVVTRGATGPLTGERQPADLGAAAVWGLLRAAQLEHPDRFVLLDTDGPHGLGDALAALLATGEPQAALRNGVLHAPHLLRLSLPAPTPVTPSTDQPDQPDQPDQSGESGESGLFGPSEGTVLLSGGGALAAVLARHLVAAHGVRHLRVLSRRGADAAGIPELTAELAGQGVELAALTCDVSDRQAVAAALADIPARHPLCAVVHTAGVLDDGLLEGLTGERMIAVLRPKVDAARHLDRLTRGADLSAFVVFSSAAGVLGSPGQASNTAANAPHH